MIQLYDYTNPPAEPLHIRRDELGVGSIYYAQLPTQVVIADELRLLLPYIRHPEIRLHELLQPIRHNYPIDLRHTWIEQVKRLRAGEEMTIAQDGIHLHTYFRRDHTPTFRGTKTEAIQEALRLMRQSVRRSIEQAPGPVAILLSGGIDSSSLAAFALENKDLFPNHEVHVISAGYKGNRYTACDEREVAKRFAQEKGLIYHEVELDVADFQHMLDEMMPWLDEPCFDVSCMAQMALYQKACKMGYKTILSGLGGDELFYSYADDNRKAEAFALRREFIHTNHHKSREQLVKFILNHWKHLLLPTDTRLMGDRGYVNWTYDDYYRFVRDARLQIDGEWVNLAGEEVEYNHPESATLTTIYDHIFSTFANTLCVYLGNRLTRANGIEIRYPLLDVELVKFLDTLPLDMKYTPGKPKQFQKDIMAGIVPDYILYAKKRGFAPPFEFIWQMCGKYQYKHFEAKHVFFNSMVADRLLDTIYSSRA